jgi:cytochrome c biogenesis protein CcmG, thiol:disulfide interchange protein DsbE
MIEEQEPRLDQPELEEYGRVGYGQVARYSPLILAVIMVAAVVFIALGQRDKQTVTREIIGQQAPNLTFTAFNGGATTELTSMAGSVVVLNFWASWCEPCQREMPAFEAVHQGSADDVQIIGVDIKNDRVENATQLLNQTGVTYQIARDDGGENSLYGPIEQALGTGGSYPVTVFITPSGIVDQVKVGPMTESEITKAIDKARS